MCGMVQVSGFQKHSGSGVRHKEKDLEEEMELLRPPTAAPWGVVTAGTLALLAEGLSWLQHPPLNPRQPTRTASLSILMNECLVSFQGLILFPH